MIGSDGDTGARTYYVLGRTRDGTGARVSTPGYKRDRCSSGRFVVAVVCLDGD